MKPSKNNKTVQMIPIERINILNPRIRNQKIFRSIAENIVNVGLKRPITVTHCHSEIPGKDYDLVCGQGRLEAFLVCGQTHIPAIIIAIDEEQALMMSLVENMARRHRSPIELIHGIDRLRKLNYDAKTIAIKTGLTAEYTRDLLMLLERGEERLLASVEAGRIPIYVAIQIAESPGNEQKILQEAYETKQLSAGQLKSVKRLLESRRYNGKSFSSVTVKGETRGNSVKEVLKTYHKQVERKRMINRRAEKYSEHIAFVAKSLSVLLREADFIKLLRVENLNSLPKNLYSLIGLEQPND